MSKSINEVAQEAHTNAIEKGWWDAPRSFGELITLCHSELSEALEDYRNGLKPTFTYRDKNGKPCGIPSELADVVIRIFDMCGRYGIDLEQAIREKMTYNATGSIRHGGKVL